MKTIRFILLLCIAVINGTLNAQNQKELGQLMRERNEYYFTLKVNDPSEIQTINGICSVDGTDGRTVVCYANQQQYDKLLQAGYQPNLQTPPSMREEAKMWEGGDRSTYEWDSYPTYSQYESMMQAFPASVADGRFCTYMELGTLSSGHKIIGVRINNGNPDGKPKFLYSSTIHGDETTGWILLLRLIDELCTSTDSRIVNLVNNLDIFIFPNTNPDGTYYGGNNTVTGSRRTNLNGVDLNRHFKDFVNGDHPDGASSYELEAQWMMDFGQANLFTMSANYHGGAELMNYPYDCTRTYPADTDWWELVSTEYVSLARQVYSSYMTSTYSDGVTNGATWYMIGGGRQDYMNGYCQCREITIECSKIKTLPASQLNSYWNYNHNSMLAYMEQCINGVHGFVYDATTNQPIDGVTITVLNHDDQYSIVSTHDAGDFHRPIKGGTWTFKFTKDGYNDESVTVSVADGQRKDLQVFLTPVGMSDYFHFITAGEWNTNTNWFGNTVPNTNGHVTIHANCTLDQNATVASLTIENGNTLTVQSGKTLTVTGTLTNAAAGNLVIADGGQLITNNAVLGTVQKSISAYTVPVNDPNNPTVMTNGWYFIASPISYNPANTNMLSNTYDLFIYDESNVMWRNYEQTGSDYYHFVMEPKKGYLYANSQNIDLGFAGLMPASNSTNVTVDLSYANDNDAVVGFNLVGNPFTYNVSGFKLKNSNDVVSDLSTYYVVEGGTEIVPSTDPIKPGQGFLVQATGAGQQLVFNYAAAKGETATKSAFIRIEAGNEIFMDRAFVQIRQGNTLRKMKIDENVAHVWLMQDGKDYAAATIAEAQGEMPVNFRANENGQYTITVSPENVEMGYLHLIDNVTGADIDLLALRHPSTGSGSMAQGPASYTFNAKTTDYASRFRLVFSTNEGDDNEDIPFAYFHNGEIVILADVCNASLQVMDVTGRVVVSRQGDAMNRVSTSGMVPGVYVLRLSDGNDVKTQKIVIR